MTLLELLKLMRDHLRLVIALPIIFALATAAVSWTVLPNTYSAHVSMYVLTKSSSSSESGTVSNTDLTASQMLTNDVASLAKSDRVKSDVAKALRLDSLSDYSISVDSQTTTRVITITAFGPSQENVAKIANQTAKSLDEIAQEVMDVQSINVIDDADVPDGPSGPPRLMYTGVAFLAGLFVAIAIVVIMDMANTRVRDVEEASELFGGVPVIGHIPVFR